MAAPMPRPGDRVRAARDLDACGSVVCRRGAIGSVVTTCSNSGRLTVRFDDQQPSAAPLRVALRDVVAAEGVRWRRGMQVETVRDLFTLDGTRIAMRGDPGVIVGRVSREPKLLAMFDTSSTTKPVRVVPHVDVEPAWRTEAKQKVITKETRKRMMHEEAESEGWRAIIRIFNDEDLTSPIPFEKYLPVLVRNLRDECSAPQSLTEWTPPPQVLHRRAVAFFSERRDGEEHFQRLYTGIKTRIIEDEGQEEYEYFHALCLWTGFFMKQDMPVCVKWLCRLASRGHAKATNMLGVYHLQEQAGREPDEHVAMTYFARAEYMQSVAGSYNMGVIFKRQAESLLSFYRFEKAAKRGHVPAQYLLSMAYLDVQQAVDGPESHRKEAAEEWLQRAVAASHEGAQYYLARRYLEDGWLDAALKLLKPAAEAGHVDAQHALGVCLVCDQDFYALGQGTSRMFSFPTGAPRGDAPPPPPQDYDAGEDLRASPWPCWQGVLPEQLRAVGEGHPHDVQQGTRWLARAAEAAHPEAQNSYAMALLHGLGVERNVAEGIALLRAAAAAENANAMHNLACCLFNGDGTDINTREALDLWRRSSSSIAESFRKLMDLARWVFKGEVHMVKLVAVFNAQAMCELLLRVNAEKGIVDSGRLATAAAIEQMAAGHTQRAASQPRVDGPQGAGGATAATAGGFERPAGPPRSPRSPRRPRTSSISQTREVPGSAVACRPDPNPSSFGVMCRIREPFDGGITKDIAGGIVGQLLEAQYSLGLQYFFGSYLDEDHQAAVQLFWRVADSSVVPHPGAQNMIGVCLQHGIGVPKHLKMAVHWFRKAANHHLPLAMHNLACCLYTGDGVKENRKEAVRWWRRAAEYEYGEALFRLALCELSGNGTDHDKQSGLEHLRHAAAQGVTRATVLCKELGGRRGSPGPLAALEGVARTEGGYVDDSKSFFSASMQRYKLYAADGKAPWSPQTSAAVQRSPRAARAVSRRSLSPLQGIYHTSPVCDETAISGSSGSPAGSPKGAESLFSMHALPSTRFHDDDDDVDTSSDALGGVGFGSPLGLAFSRRT